MEGIIIHTNSGDYMPCQPGSGVISVEKDILDLLAYCFEDYSKAEDWLLRT